MKSGWRWIKYTFIVCPHCVSCVDGKPALCTCTFLPGPPPAAVRWRGGDENVRQSQSECQFAHFPLKQKILWKISKEEEEESSRCGESEQMCLLTELNLLYKVNFARNHQMLQDNVLFPPFIISPKQILLNIIIVNLKISLFYFSMW